MQSQYDGFWFPASLRSELITPDRIFEYLHFRDGILVPEGDDDTVTVRWPRLDLDDWQRALGILQRNREDFRGENWAERLPRAMERMQALWADSYHPLRQTAMKALETCTGHSVGMLNVALSLLDLISVEDLQTAASCRLTNAVKDTFLNDCHTKTILGGIDD